MNASPRQFQIGDIQLDIERQSVTRGGNIIDMAGLSFRLLKVLADHWPSVVSRRKLLREVWGDVVVSDDALRQRIRLLRQSLGESEYISAVKGIGYRLTGPVRVTKSNGHRLKFFIALSVVAMGFVAFAMLSGDLGYELFHKVRHLLRH